MPTIPFRTRLARAALLTAAAIYVVPAAPAAAQQADAELPGYYQWYRKAGDDPRLPDEVRRDASPEDATWAPRDVQRELPATKLPNGTGELVDLVRDDGRWTVIVTTQAWW